MALIRLDEPTTKRIPPETFSLWALAFRPFYLLAGLFAAIAVPVWAVGYSGAIELPMPGIWWHAHEMIFGFAVAVIIGFLFTRGAQLDRARHACGQAAHGARRGVAGRSPGHGLR